MSTTRNLAILVFDDAEVLDFCGPFEVFSVTGLGENPRPFNVYLVAEQMRPVLARNGLSVNPHYTIADCPQPDIILIPGGMGTRREMHNDILIDWIRKQAKCVELILSVCTGALMLAKARLLDGLDATTHHGAIDLLRDIAPDTIIHPDPQYVDNGKIILSAGISAGIDMSLHVVARLLSKETALATAQYMEYDWPG